MATSPAAPNVTASTFPARSKQVVRLIDNARTDVTTTKFSDKIVITISQDGRLVHWVHVPLGSADPNAAERLVNPASHGSAEDDGSGLLPMSHLTATTILGGSVAERTTLGELFATQIGSAIMTKTPQENRLLVMGIGFKSTDMDRDKFQSILDLVLDCI